MKRPPIKPLAKAPAAQPRAEERAYEGDHLKALLAAGALPNGREDLREILVEYIDRQQGRDRAQATIERRARELCKARAAYVAALCAAADERVSNEAVAFALSRAKGAFERAHDALAELLTEGKS